jgi:hypothetical protein
MRLRSSDGPISKTAHYTAVVSSRQVEPVIKEVRGAGT